MYRSNLFDYREYGPSTLEQKDTNPVYHPLDSDSMVLSPNAETTLKEATKKVAEHFNLNLYALSEKLSKNFFLQEPSGFLVIVIQVEKLDAEMFVEIPPEHWWIDKKIQS